MLFEKNLPFYVFGTQISQPHIWLLQQQLLQKNFQQYHLFGLYKKLPIMKALVQETEK